MRTQVYVAYASVVLEPGHGNAGPLAVGLAVWAFTEAGVTVICRHTRLCLVAGSRTAFCSNMLHELIPIGLSGHPLLCRIT